MPFKRNDPCFLPYLPLIRFFGGIRIDLDLDIEPKEVNNMGNIHLRELDSIYLNKKALYILSNIIMQEGNALRRLDIDTEDSEIDVEAVNGMGVFNLRIVDGLYLYNKALYLLQIINTTNAARIHVHSNNSEIDSTIVNGMGTIEIGKVNVVYLFNMAFYILPRIRINVENEIFQFEIYTKDSMINTLILDGMGSIDLENAKSLRFYNTSFYILPKIITKNGDRARRIHIDTKESNIDSLMVDDMVTIELSRLEDLQLANKAFYLLPKMCTTGTNEIKGITINTEASEIDIENVNCMGFCQNWKLKHA
eukprot:GHVP01016004.1.p1 GENE.GHVP01016004.1~~GHVP01016004.1.p1  ORF type:complete len:331 (-),score=39.67 GHVP01016004.1:705-1628(-)